MRKLTALLLLAVATLLAGPATGQTTKPASTSTSDFSRAEPAQPLPEPARAALESIQAPTLAAHIAFLASPALEGRGLTSRGLDAAAEYLASSLAVAGIPPLAATGKESGATAAYFQQVPIRELRNLSAGITVERRAVGQVHTREFLSGVDCLVPVLPPQTTTASVVFAGYGIPEPALGRDDLAGMDLQGKVVLVLGGLPPGSQWQTPDLVARYGDQKARQRYAAKLEALRPLKPLAVLAVEATDLMTRTIREDAPEEYRFRSYDPTASPDDEPPLVQVSTVVADALLASAGLTSRSAVTARSRDLPGVTATIRVSGAETLAWGRNVVGVIAGSDPKLREEAVVIGAHMDHLGRIGETTYPGADDNASGVASLLEIARALQRCEPKPKRTVVVAFWTGEEEGKLGSGHWVRHPLWPLGRTVAYLNLDMVGHPWSVEEIRTLVADAKLPNGETFLAGLNPADFVEPGVADWAPELGETLIRAGHATGLALHLDRSDGKRGGSDYRDFARAGVPWVRFFGNFFPGYHEPADTPDTLDPEQVRRVARLCLATAYLLADS
ncbi:MAG: M20/M25/M40 family metallo-hydrolase [Thermoanaerobaculaceae bacterium]|jgi:hypothetical protein|nr:M20/M25/M40 family metallo-hydrolase [Thermoanaerobaculaceae bacterium]